VSSMPKEIEIEFKNILTAEEFRRLLQAFHLDEEDFTLQHNDYFDTPNFSLKAQHAALRIREKEGKCTLTLKQPGAFGLIETHQNIRPDEAEAIRNGRGIPGGEVQNALAGLNIDMSQLKMLGRLSTKRAEILYRDGRLAFDHSFYGTKEDYELEYEAPEAIEGEKTFLDLLNRFGIPKRPTDNKIKRLMNELSHL